MREGVSRSAGSGSRSARSFVYGVVGAVIVSSMREARGGGEGLDDSPRGASREGGSRVSGRSAKVFAESPARWVDLPCKDLAAPSRWRAEVITLARGTDDSIAREHPMK